MRLLSYYAVLWNAWKSKIEKKSRKCLSVTVTVNTYANIKSNTYAKASKENASIYL